MPGPTGDITEQRDALRQAEEGRRWLEAVEKLALVGYWHVDLGASELFWSPEVYRIHDRDPALGPPLLGNAIDYYHPDDRPLVAEYLDQAIRQQSGFDFVLRLLLESGEIRWVEARGEIEPNGAGEPVGVFGAVCEVTERRAVLESIERRNEELEEFAYVTSHDMRNPFAWCGAMRSELLLLHDLKAILAFGRPPGGGQILSWSTTIRPTPSLRRSS